MMDERSTASARKYNKYKGRYCVAGYKNQISCKNTSYTHGVTIHQFPCDPETRAKWTKFVQKHRPDFQAPPERRNIALCSAHFKDECFNKPRLSLNGLENIKFQRRVTPDRCRYDRPFLHLSNGATFSSTALFVMALYSSC